MTVTTGDKNILSASVVVTVDLVQYKPIWSGSWSLMIKTYLSSIIPYDLHAISLLWLVSNNNESESIIRKKFLYFG